MTSIEPFRTSARDEPDNFYARFSEARLAVKIGQDLRGLYGEFTSEALPERLADLASRIDARRRADGTDG